MKRRRLKTGATLVLRSLLIQGSWNYRTLIGSGVAWALLPFLPRDPEPEANERLARAGELFNSHPYLASLALGSLVRLDEEGAGAETTRRFRDAVRGPLGSLGDGLVWAGWRPLCLLGAILWAVMGGPPGWIVLGFLLAYNSVHFGLRIWGVRTGLARGLSVGPALRDLDLPRWTERIATAGVLVVGVLLGALLGRGMGALSAPAVWITVGAGFLLAGIAGGASFGRWAPGILLFLTIATLLAGAAIFP